MGQGELLLEAIAEQSRLAQAHHSRAEKLRRQYVDLVRKFRDGADVTYESYTRSKRERGIIGEARTSETGGHISYLIWPARKDGGRASNRRPTNVPENRVFPYSDAQ